MFDGIEKIFEQLSKAFAFFWDGTQSRLKRFSTVIFLVVSFFMLNDGTQWTYFQTVTKKTDRIERLESLLKADSMDTLTRQKLVLLEHEVLSRQSLLESFSGLLKDKIQSLRYSILPTTAQTKNTASIMIIDFLHVFTAAYGLIILLVVLLLSPFLAFKEFEFKNIPRWLISIAVLCFLIWLFSVALAFVPVLPYHLNYLLNFAVQTPFTFALAKYIEKHP